MKQRRPTQEHTLESLRFFPHVAWILTLGFAIFVFNMTRNITSEVNSLHERTQELESQISAPKQRPATQNTQP